MTSQEVLIESFKESHPRNNIYHKPKNINEALNLLSHIGSEKDNALLTESANAKYYINEAYNLIQESIKKDNNIKWPYVTAPYFTYEEVKQFEGYYHDSPTILSENWYATNLGNEEQRSWDKKVKELIIRLRIEENPDEINRIKQDLINLGWNPELDYNIENQIKAVNRIEKILNEKNNILTLDITSLIEFYKDSIINESSKSTIKPIHIVLVRGNGILSPLISNVTKGDFSHSAICIDNDFSKLYSFNMNNERNFVGGFSIEDVNKYPRDNRLAVFTFFVSKDDYARIKERVKMLSDNIKSTSYSVINLLTIPFKDINLNMSNSMICSQFVDSILKMARINITGKNSSKVNPNNLYNVSIANSRVYKIFDGIAKDFNPTKASKYINKMAKSAKPFVESNNEISSIIYEYTYPVVTEARSPIQFNKDGDLLLTNKIIDFDAEYSASHKLLLNYEKTNNIEGMKYELARLYYMNYILERKLYHNKYLSNKEKNMKTRARVLNDFNKYLNHVLSKEPNFNFAKYYEESVFYPHTIEVKQSTLLKFKDIINYIL
jgi:hypothetical protein